MTEVKVKTRRGGRDRKKDKTRINREKIMDKGGKTLIYRKTHHSLSFPSS